MSSTKNIGIREASARDMPAIRELVGEFPNKLMQHNLPLYSAFLVATDGGNVVGCCALEVYSKRLAEIRSLAVTKGFQHKGIGKKLIRACIAAAKKSGVYEILCITGTPDVFERHGFGTFNKEKYALIKVLKG